MPPVTRSKTTPIGNPPNVAIEARPPEDQNDILVATRNEPSSITSHDIPPVYTIDLSLPPSQRYVKAATDYKTQIQELTVLFEEVLNLVGISLKVATWLSWAFLRGLYSKEQTEEIRGVGLATGVDMYLLVAFNTLLDLFMGCTSGAVKVRNESGAGTKMLHFRTLDWGMDMLRKVIVQLEYVERPGGPVIARSITYVGFVGILTGVRKDLSVSLNFRPYHDNDTSRSSNFRFYSNHLLVLLGIRPSISSMIRSYILPARPSAKTVMMKSKIKIENTDSPSSSLPQIEEIAKSLPSIPSTVAYLIFCSGASALILEKDHRTAQSHTSTSFLVATNHDADPPSDGPDQISLHASKMALAGMQDLVGESRERKECVAKQWEKAVQRHRRRNRDASEENVAVETADVLKWVQKYPIRNEQTHYACVMDPTEGTIIWVKKYEVDEYSDRVY